MDFSDIIRLRKSYRAYKTDPVSDETLGRVLEAARMAPSWCNRQCWRFIIVRDAQVKKMLGEEVANPSAECYANAPVVVAVCADPTDSGATNGKEYYLVDCAIAMEHFVLAAANEGLGTCWVGAFSEYPVRNLLHIPKEVKIVALTPLGVPEGDAQETGRKPLSEIVYSETWKANSNF